MTRVLVTGGAGFLGRRVVAALAAHPDVDAVVAADVRPHTPETEGAIAAVCDVTDRPSVDAALREHRIDTVVHLAAIVNAGRDTHREYRVDVTGSENVVQACLATGVRRIVVSSSGAAYGYHADNPLWLREDHPLRGNNEFPYSRHKRLVEEMLAATRRSHPQLEQVVFRIGTILGPTVQNQITALWQGRRLLRVAGADSPFVFVWVDDVAAAMVRAATDGPAGVFNVAGDGALTVPQIAARLRKPLLTLPAGVLAWALRIGRALRLTPHGPEHVGFLRYRPVLSNDRLKNEFGFTPTRTSRQAFDEYVRAQPAVSRKRHPDAAPSAAR